tara:strand:- start:6062 stop:6274 length:213 start_codon:yes stop_codon:yes gene_type:complete
MSKTKENVKLSDNHVAEPETAFKGKSNDELKEVRDTLKNQLQQYQTMAIKASGALEVLEQLIEESPEDDS